jgi:hypothetical protein
VSISFYGNELINIAIGMKEIMPKRAHRTLTKIIAEEKLHLRQLSDLKRSQRGRA